MYFRRIRLLLVALSCVFLSFSAAAENSFYAGKTLNIVVPFSTGGGHDQWARLIAPYLKDNLGLGQVKVINRPGGGGLIANNEVYASEADGLTIEVASPGAIFAQVFHSPGIKYDAKRWSVLGSMNYGPYVFLTHPDGQYQSFDDLVNAKETVVSLATGKGGASYQIPNIVLNAFDVPHKMVAGFSGSHGVISTFLTGNGDMFGTTSPHLKSLGSRVKPLIFVSNEPLDEYEDVPTLLDEIDKQHIQGRKKAALESLANLLFTDVLIVGPPDIAPDRMDALQAALKKAADNPELQRQAAQSDHTVRYTSGAEIRDAVQNMLEYEDEFRRLNQ